MIFNKSVKHRYLTFKLIRWVSSLSNCMLYSSTNKLLFTRKLDFFNIRGVRFGIVRTSMRLTHLASFQAKELMYAPNRSGNDRHLIRLVLSEAFSTKHSILWIKCCLRRGSTITKLTQFSCPVSMLYADHGLTFVDQEKLTFHLLKADDFDTGIRIFFLTRFYHLKRALDTQPVFGKNVNAFRSNALPLSILWSD